MEDLVSRIGIPFFIQIIIEIWNCIFLIIMILSILISIRLSKKNKTVVEEPYFAMEIVRFYTAVFMYNLFNVLGIIYDGASCSAGRCMTSIADFGYYLVGAFQTLFFLQLIKKYVAKKNGLHKLETLTIAVQCLHIPLLLLLAATPFTGALYSITPDNYYVRGPFFSIWHIITIVSFVYIFIVYVMYRRSINILLQQIILSATIIPFIGFMLNTVYSVVSFNNISVSLCSLIIFICYEKNRSVIAYETASELQYTKTVLAEKKLALEHRKNELLLAQIQPHFINNSLMALRSRCCNYPEIYDSLTNFSRYLRSHFEALGDVELIPFEYEMDNIEAYLALEEENFGERRTVEYDIECDDFLVPALSVQPLVENAVRHGVGTYDKGGLVKICTKRSDNTVLIEITDSGKGQTSPTDQQIKRKSIGIENVRARLGFLSGGKLELIKQENGTCARITINEHLKKE